MRARTGCRSERAAAGGVRHRLTGYRRQGLSASTDRPTLWLMTVRKTDRESVWAKLARPFRRKQRMVADDENRNRRAEEAEPDKDEVFHKLLDITYQGPYGN